MEKPTFKQKVDGFCNFLYNGETGQLLGRGAKSWGEIGLFYLIYYICLSAFFAATITVFHQTLDDSRPKLQDDSSLLKANPGLGYKPMPDIDTTLVHVIEKNAQDFNESINSILAKYDDASQKGLVDCSSEYKTRPDAEKACKFDVKVFEQQCGEQFGYTGANPQPCVLLKLNKIYNWEPKPYTDKPDELVLPEGVAYNQNQVWIHCIGENGADKDNIGSLQYFPQQGFSLAYYPYLNQKNYKAPLVMVKFLNPTPGIGLMVECTAFASNIEVDSMEKLGSVKFELLVGK